ncbi:phosphotransferase [candidate division TA06 bacterium]|nr:phosphotransferase [candidate division TA06 bacterium]
MESRIKERFNKNILAEAMQRYAVPEGKIRELGGFESFIHSFERDSRHYILRISHSLRRSEELIRGEADWINYLAAGGVPVAGAVMSENGNLVEAIDDGHGGLFLATAFNKIDGRPIHEAGWSPQLYRTYGKLLGKMHSLTKDYRPSDPLAKRPQWEDSANTECVKHLPETESLVREKYWKVMEQVAVLPRDKDSFGLIHYDAHSSNMLVDKDGRLCLFDFDDSLHSWFVCDIAIVLFYMTAGKEPDIASVEEFLAHFLSGYAEENKLDPKWLKEIPHFLKIREIDLYAVIHRSFDVSNITNPWVAGFMKGRKEKIEGDVPFLDLDFGAWAGHLTSPLPLSK